MCHSNFIQQQQQHYASITSLISFFHLFLSLSLSPTHPAEKEREH